MSMKDLAIKVRELKKLKAMMDELNGEIIAIEDELKAHMTAQGIDELAVDIFKVRYKEVKSNRFDTTSFKATHTELYNQYTKQTTSRRFTVA